METTLDILFQSIAVALREDEITLEQFEDAHDFLTVQHG
jgi:hypothetical protein